MSLAAREMMSKLRRGKPKSAKHLAVMRSPEYRGKIRAKAIGRGHSAETKAKIAEITRGRKHSDEAKAKMALAQKGKHHSEATKAKLRAAMVGKKHAARSPLRPGDPFGRLIVLRRDEGSDSGRYKWICRCECGKEISARQCNLRTGNTSSCGCLRLERLREAIQR